MTCVRSSSLRRYVSACICICIVVHGYTTLLQFCNAVYNQNTTEKFIKGCILPIPQKGDLGLTKNHRGITLTSIVAKVYYDLLLNHIKSEIEKILRKKSKRFSTKSIHNFTNYDGPSNHRRSSYKKNFEAKLWIVDFSKAFDSLHKRKIQQIFLVYCHPKKLSQR